MSKKSRERYNAKLNARKPGNLTPPVHIATAADMTPDWTEKCEVCGQTPVVPLTGMCGPCTFGESDTAGGNW